MIPKLSTKTIVTVIPIAIFFSLAVLEVGLWVFRPLAWFHPRGFEAPNLRYESIIYGDYINNATDVDPNTGTFRAVPVYRPATIITDSYGKRNNRTAKTAFAALLGDSMAMGDGSSHEDIPTQQLSRMIGRKIILPYTPSGFDRFGRMAMYIHHRQPTKSNVVIFLLHDQWFLEPLSKTAPVDQIDQALMFNRYENKDTSWQAAFRSFKVEVRAWSGNAILARKAKTILKHAAIKGLSFLNIYHHQTGLEYLPYKTGNVIVEKLPENIADVTVGNKKFDRIVAGTVKLAELAKAEGLRFVVVIIPAKEYPYNQFRRSPVPLREFGPASEFNRILVNAGIDTVFSHPPLFEAVSRQMKNQGPAVYWEDDTHWNPYGIRLTMELVRDKLDDLGILKN
jgi:hypothetical protein